MTVKRAAWVWNKKYAVFFQVRRLQLVDDRVDATAKVAAGRPSASLARVLLGC